MRQYEMHVQQIQEVFELLLQSWNTIEGKSKVDVWKHILSTWETTHRISSVQLYIPNMPLIYVSQAVLFVVILSYYETGGALHLS